MANRASIALVLVILLSGVAVGALAGYRMHLTAGLDAEQGPVTAVVIIQWPDDTPAFEQNVTVDAKNATALGFTLQAALEGNFTIGTEQGALGVYVQRIGEHISGTECGWLYAVGHEGNEPQDGDRSAELVRVFEGGTVLWYWGCIAR